jgi:hypothetical protein
MNDLKTQRNVAIGVAAVVVAFAAGYLISSVGDAPSVPLAGEELAVESSPADFAGPSDVAAIEAPRAVSPPAPSAQPTAPAVGERRRVAPRPSEPVEHEAVYEEPMAAAAAPAFIESPRRLVPVTIPRSTPIVLDLLSPASSQTSQVGDEVVAELVVPIRVGGEVVVAAGTRVTGRVSEAQALRKVGGKSILALTFDRLESGDGGAAIAAGFRREGKSETGKDAATIAAGAAIGTILGNQARRNDRGKLIGAVVGAAAGTAVASKTEGETIELPSGARLELTLQTDVEVMVDRD